MVDLFCGCGGGSLGLKLSGHEVVAAVDVDPIACETYSKNLGLEPIQGDISRLTGHEIIEKCGLLRGDVDLVVGCPPCQGFSSLRRTRYPKGEDPRKDLVSVFFERVKEIQPKAVLLENVPGIAWGGDASYLHTFISRIESIGYKTSWDIIDAADYGVPQHRRRVVALSVKDKVRPRFPSPPTHGNPEDRYCDDRKPWKTVRNAIGDLPPLAPGEAHPSIPNHEARNHKSGVLNIISKIPRDGGSRRSLPYELWLPCHKRLKERSSRGAESIYGRIRWDTPSPTMTSRCTTPSSGRFVHPEQDRAITPREAARLQTFRDYFVFPRETEQTERLIGNAVPADLMIALSKGFEEAL